MRDPAEEMGLDAWAHQGTSWRLESRRVAENFYEFVA